MRLYHERQQERPGAIDGRDEEECFTAVGRRQGVFLTTEPLDGPLVFTVDVPEDLVADYEVTGEGGAHRVFVVPGSVVADLQFTA